MMGHGIEKRIYCEYQYCYLMRDDAPCTNMRAGTICRAKRVPLDPRLEAQMAYRDTLKKHLVRKG